MTLREHRQRLHLSIDELSRRVGVERSKLSRAERGYVELRDDEVKRIAALLGVSTKKLTVYAPA